jgi:hypothetical protein
VGISCDMVAVTMIACLRAPTWHCLTGQALDAVTSPELPPDYDDDDDGVDHEDLFEMLHRDEQRGCGWRARRRRGVHAYRPGRPGQQAAAAPPNTCNVRLLHRSLPSFTKPR